MKLIIDTESSVLQIENDNWIRTIELYSKEAFEVISEQWLKVGWNEKYEYTFSWFGRPLIQLPEDIVRIQEVIYNIKPDLIIETGVAHGGSLIFYASLCKAMDRGKVVGIDIEIRPHNRKALEEHELYEFITLIEGSSIDKDTFEKVKRIINPNDKVLVLLDSCHTKDHVYKELELYSQLISKGSYIIVEDGVMKDLHDVPRGDTKWIYDNPSSAAIEFVNNNQNFIIERPKWVFNESKLEKNITHWPNAWIKRIND